MIKEALYLKPYLYLKPFFPMFPFDPPENIRKPKIFCCFQGDQKGKLVKRELKNLPLNA